MTARHVLFVSYALVGHLNPLTAVMQSLRGRGCRVTCFMPCEDTIDPVRRAALEGVELVFCTSASQGPRASALTDVASAEEWARGLVEAAPELVAALRRAIRACAPDFVVIDPFPRTAFALAATHVEGLPYGLLWPNLLPVAPQELRTGLAKCVDDAMRDVVVPFGVEWCEEFASPRSPILNMAPVIPELIGGPVPRVHCVGFPQPPERRGDEVEFDWSRLPGKPFVYVSFGTIQHRRDRNSPRARAAMEVVFRSAEQLGLGVLASVGPLVDDLGPLGEHVVLAEYVPQREVLRRASAFVTHGGYNSVTEALRVGTPMLVLPLAVDQPLQAHYTAQCGAGRALVAGELTEEATVDALRSLTAPASSYRMQAERLSGLDASVDTTMTTVNLILQAMDAPH